MVDFDLAVGYGIVINVEVWREMRAKIFDTFFNKNPDHCIELMDTLENQWSIRLDSWSDNDEYFLGAIRHFDTEDVFMRLVDSLNIDKREINDFINFSRETGIFSIFKKDWKPELCLIRYCH